MCDTRRDRWSCKQLDRRTRSAVSCRLSFGPPGGQLAPHLATARNTPPDFPCVFKQLRGFKSPLSHSPLYPRPSPSPSPIKRRLEFTRRAGARSWARAGMSTPSAPGDAGMQTSPSWMHHGTRICTTRRAQSPSAAMFPPETVTRCSRVAEVRPHNRIEQHLKQRPDPHLPSLSFPSLRTVCDHSFTRCRVRVKERNPNRWPKSTKDRTGPDKIFSPTDLYLSTKRHHANTGGDVPGLAHAREETHTPAARLLSMQERADNIVG